MMIPSRGHPRRGARSRSCLCTVFIQRRSSLHMDVSLIANQSSPYPLYFVSSLSTVSPCSFSLSDANRHELPMSRCDRQTCKTRSQADICVHLTCRLHLKRQGEYHLSQVLSVKGRPYLQCRSTGRRGQSPGVAATPRRRAIFFGHSSGQIMMAASDWRGNSICSPHKAS